MPHRSNENSFPNKLTIIQEEIIIGGLLGDSSISLDGKYPRMKIERQIRDKLYLEWQYNFFEEFCCSGIKESTRYDSRYNKYRTNVHFRTRAVPAFAYFYNKWYGSGKKQVPDDIELTPLILAVWFADDGCIVKDKNNLTLKLSTESFGENGALLLSSKLSQRFNEKFPIYRKAKDKDQFFIKTSTCPAQLFIKDIEHYIIEMNMIRKYNKWKNVSLDMKPKIGLKSRDRSELYDAILYLNDFSVKQLSDTVKSYTHDTINNLLSDFIDQNLLIRYESDDKFNLYHYNLTDLGKEYFRNKQNYIK